jgi:hypothetical protein
MYGVQYAGQNVFVAIFAGQKNLQNEGKQRLVWGITAASAALPLVPFFTVTVWACAANDDRVCRRAHLDSVWAEDHVSWHVDHHQAKIRMQTGASRGRWRMGVVLMLRTA